MKKAVNLCKLHRKLMSLLGVVGVIFLIVVIGTLVADVNYSDSITQFGFGIVLIAAVVGLAYGALCYIVRAKARKAVCRELKRLIEYHFKLNNDSTKINEIFVGESDYEHTYTVYLTKNVDLYVYEELIVDLKFLRSNLASALNKRVNFYCNGIWVT